MTGRSRPWQPGREDIKPLVVLIFPGKFDQLPAQLSRQEDSADLPLQRDVRPAGPGCLQGDIGDLPHPDAGGAHGLHQQRQLFPALVPGSGQEFFVLLVGQLPAGVPEHPPLNLQIPGPASLPAQKAEQAVHRRQHGVHRGRRTAAGEKLLLPGADRLAVHRPVPQPQGKGIDVSLIFCNGAGAALLPLQVLGKFG